MFTSCLNLPEVKRALIHHLSRAFSAGKSTNYKRCHTSDKIESWLPKVELGSTLCNMLPQLATLKFVTWQVESECSNTGNNAFQFAMQRLSENVARITWPYILLQQWEKSPSCALPMLNNFESCFFLFFLYVPNFTKDVSRSASIGVLTQVKHTPARRPKQNNSFKLSFPHKNVSIFSGRQYRFSKTRVNHLLNSDFVSWWGNILWVLNCVSNHFNMIEMRFKVEVAFHHVLQITRKTKTIKTINQV